VITTHSPYFLNQFSATDWFPLALNEDRATVSRPCRLIRNDRDLRVALGKYGLRPPEALLSKRVVIVEGPNDVTLIRELIDIHTGCSADRQDLLVIPAGGKDLVSDLCLLLDELGANWVGVMDWDAVLDTRQPNMQSGLSAADVAAVNNAIATIDGKRHKHAGTPSRLEKILDGLREELSKSSAPFQPDFSYSVLGRHLTKSKALNATEIATLKRDLKQRSMRPVRDVLTKAKLWIWSSTPEELLLNTQSAESLVESKLIEHQILKSVVQVANRKKTLVKSLHGLAHKPEILQDIIRSLHLAGEMRRRETRDLVNRIVA
jgi:hypothetical protein